MRVGHLDRVGDRSLGLLFEAGGAAVPELRAAENAVVRDRRVAAAHLPAHADAELRVGAKALIGIMAARAADRAVGREPLVEIELPPQFDQCRRQRVGFEHGLGLLECLRSVPAADRFRAGQILRLVEPGFDLFDGQITVAGDAGGQVGRAELARACRRGSAARRAGSASPPAFLVFAECMGLPRGRLGSPRPSSRPGRFLLGRLVRNRRQGRITAREPADRGGEIEAKSHDRILY